MTVDERLREVSDRLLPEESPTFLEDFWAGAEAREHLAARRWRRAALAFAVAAALAVTAAAVVAAPFGHSNVVDQKLSCATLEQGGLHVFSLAVAPQRRTRPNWILPTSAQVVVVTGASAYLGTKLVALDNAAKGYMINRKLCTDGPSIPLAPSGLPRADVLPKLSSFGVEYRCLREGRIAVRVRLTQGPDGEPTKAQIAIRMAKTKKPVAYAEWSPQKVTAWASPSCTTSEF